VAGAAAGVSQVACQDSGLARPQDLSPAGLGLPDTDAGLVLHTEREAREARRVVASADAAA